MEGLWKVCGRSVEGLWKVCGRFVEGLWKVCGESLGMIRKLLSTGLWRGDFGPPLPHVSSFLDAGGFAQASAVPS